QVSVRQDHGPPAADLLRTAPARHGAPRLVKVPGQPGEWHPPAQRQGKGGACPQDGRPVQQKVVPPFLAQGAEPGKHDGGHQHHRHQRVLPHGGGILPQGGGVEAGDGTRLLAGPLLRLRHQIRRLVIRGGHAEGVPQSPALPGSAPHGKHQGEAPHRGIAGDGAPLRQHQPGHTVRRHHHGGDHRQQLAGASLLQQRAERLGEYLPGQDGHRRKARQQHTALDGCVAGPVADLIAVGLDPHRDHRQQ
ncbi:ABC-type lipoprotein export system, ATPase component, partial [Dysosmobacter welbionis]